jgi:Holliday junction resolvasome RuvABC endonuclease subunit
MAGKVESKNLTRILALDPSTRTGWAHSCGQSGVWDLSIRRDESKGMRLIRLRGKLNEIRAAVGVDLVVYEAARHAAPKMQGALVVQAEIQGVIVLWCEDNHIQYVGLSPSEIKKHATGKGNAGKDQMLAAAKAKWPDMEIVDDNNADALWILDLARQRYLAA